MKKYQLQDIHREIKRSQKKAIKKTYKRTLSQLTLEEILASGALHKDEVDILKEYMEYRGGTLILNENTIKGVSSELLDEGIIDWLRDKGEKAVDLLKSGWESVKNVWSNFKDFVASIVQKIKEAFKKLWEWMKGKAKEIIGWVREIPSKMPDIIKELTPEQQKAIPEEFKELSACATHLKNYFVNLMNGGDWEGKLESGDLKVGSIDESIFRDKGLILTLKELKLNEAGLHPEDLLKEYPILHKILKYTIEGLKWIFNFPIKLVQTIISKATDGILKGVGVLSSKTGGPGPFDFAVLGTLLAEGGEVLGHNFELVHHSVENLLEWTTNGIKASLAWAGPVADVFAIICHVIGTGAYYYAIATVILTYRKLIIQSLEKTPTIKESIHPEFLRMQKLAGIT